MASAQPPDSPPSPPTPSSSDSQPPSSTPPSSSSPSPPPSSSPPPPSNNKSPPPPSVKKSPPLPSNSNSSSPPPPKLNSSPAPPPIKSNSSPPPPSPSSNKSSPPTPSPSNKISSPPPPSSPSSETISPPPPHSSNENTTPLTSPPPPSLNNNIFSPPPPPQSSSKTDLSPPPPPESNNESSSKNDSTISVVPIILGVVVGVAGLLLLASLIYLCSRKKKKNKKRLEYDYYSNDPSPYTGGNYYNTPTPQRPVKNWHAGKQQQQHKNDQMGNLHPSPGVQGWQPQSSPAPQTPGPQGPVLPPPHPTLALGFTHNSFSYEELVTATDGFSQANLLGQGGFGYVHKGILRNGKEIAVKSLKVGSGQGDREFQAEVDIISRVHHRHLVSLVGYCMAGGQRLLVYEFLPNSTLEHHLHGDDQPTMDWPTRLKIAIGSAKGLAYLHEDCYPRIIHRDIKASNILLDFNFEAKVADFGLAKLNSDNFTHVSTRVMGTFGYLAPEYASSGKLTEKSDVFSFGIMLLELISGRPPVDINSDFDDSLVDWARPLCASGNFAELADPRLEGNYDGAEMARMVACAGASIRHSARRRPKMSQIARILEGDGSLEHLNDVNADRNNKFDSISYSSEYDTAAYSADIKKFRKMILACNNEEYVSSEFGHTSEYGLNPSPSSSEEGSGKNSPRSDSQRK